MWNLETCAPQMGKMLLSNTRVFRLPNMTISIFVLKYWIWILLLCGLEQARVSYKKNEHKTSALFTLQSYCDDQIIYY